MQKSHTPFTAGQQVIVRDERWAVLKADVYQSTTVLTLGGVDQGNRDERQSVLAPFETITRVATTGRLRHRSHQTALAAAARAVAEAVPWDECWTAAAARIDVRAWQLEPAMAAVSGTTRLMLADAVGLGKTIQAGLIASELVARTMVARVLILTPPSLRQQWVDELRARLGLTLALFDQPTLAATVASLPPDINPWKTAPLIVSSIDLVKRGEVRVALDAVPFDLLIVDEAHHVTPGTDRADVVAAVAARTPWVVLVTATPHSGDDEAYDFLTRLGSAGGGAMRVFRRARGAGERTRRSRMLMVTPTADELALLDGTREYARALASCHRRGGAALVGAVIARRAASAATAAARTLARREALLAGQPMVGSQPALPWDELDASDDEVPQELLAAAGLADVGREREWLGRLRALAEAAAARSSKVAVLRRLLRRTREPLIVFSEYRDVVLHVAGALGDLTTIAAIHGGLPLRERLRVVDAFNRGAVRTLVATDAAGEGLNLHARCRLVVNVELPWTPLRLEQRIGRVDRLGQTRRVHALHLAHRSSYEGTVIARLERRRARALARHTADEAVEAPTGTALRRRLLTLGREPRNDAAGGVCSSRRARHQGSALLIFVTPLLTTSGQLVQRHATAVRVGVSPVRQLTRALARALIQDARVRAPLDADVRAQVERATRTTATVSAELLVRYSALIARGARRAGRAAWQASLFDQHAGERSERRRLEHVELLDHLERHVDRVSQLQHLRAGESQLVAAWLSGD